MEELGHLEGFGFIGICLKIFGVIWRYLEGFGNIWRDLETFGGIWRYLDSFGHFWRDLVEFGDNTLIFQLMFHSFKYFAVLCGFIISLL